ncbi:alpha-N-acetylgalactosamine-specific lectin-like [Branchiostoma lanceolatum]|uniref:alpha-N-acetylgalactosamine-specific lectin-like n=1 Tax=Branchiostoma lanceolatum TaxID=7740 RepID=UPI0034545B56
MAAVLLSLVVVGLVSLAVINREEISQLSTTFDALKRHQDMSTSVDALEHDQDDMRKLSNNVDALKCNLEKERSRTNGLEQRLREIETCPKGYTMRREICYKAYNTESTFNEAAVTWREDGGTLAMPRDDETNAFLMSLYKSVHDKAFFWFGLRDQREEGNWEWVDGSALGMYNSWAPGQPNNYGDNEDCAYYSRYPSLEDTWAAADCKNRLRFICQVVPGTSYNRTIS